MKKMTFSAMMSLLFLAGMVEARTFQVLNSVRVIKHPEGKVQVVGSSEDIGRINVLGQHCPDRHRPGCDEDIPIAPFSSSATEKWFQRDVEGIRRGQISFNFLSSENLDTGEWLLIPDCNVHPEGFVWEITTHDPGAARSPRPGTTATQFTDPYAGYVPLHREVKWSEICEGQVAVAPPSRVVSPKPSVPSRPVITGGGRGEVTATASGTRSMAASAKDSALSQVKVDNSINISGGKGKGKGGVKIGKIVKKDKTQVYAPSSRGGSVVVKGSNKGTINNCTYIYNYGTQTMDSGSGQNCLACHADVIKKKPATSPAKKPVQPAPQGSNGKDRTNPWPFPRQ